MTLEQSLDPSLESPSPVQDARGDHVRLGVGARFTLVPATDEIVPVILGALAVGRAAVPEVGVRTDDVSTLVRGTEQDIARYLTAVLCAAVASTPSGHVVAAVGLSRGCPGEVGCVLPRRELARVPAVRLRPTGLRSAAHWALYPLGTADAMGPITRAIGLAEAAGTLGPPESFVTRLDGDLAAVVATSVDTWAAVGHEVAHVTAHATISLGSPSLRPTSGPTSTAGNPGPVAR